jgi:ring-1,2-phenylacetyl-CoA epoxidase subunit PaaE
MPKFHILSVKEVRKETADTVSVAFDVPVELQSEYDFIQGQYLTLRKEINGEDVRRSYSICASPLDNEVRVAIKKVEDGRFSTFANEVLQAGDSLEVMTPMGRFYTELKPENDKRYVAFAAGSGITPIMSIMKTVLKTEPNSEFILFYGNRKTDSIIFKEEIEALKNIYLERLSVYHVLSREALGSPLFEGRIDKERTAKFCNLFLDVNTVDEFFLCGPEEMIFGVKDQLAELGVDAKKVHFELFTSPAGKLGAKKAKKKAPVTEGLNDVSIILDGHSYSFQLGEAGKNILDAALAEGADLPFACKGGVCCTCRAKVKEGSVNMDVNYALEPWEVEQGFVLTCQSHPTSKKVVVDFDEA